MDLSMYLEPEFEAAISKLSPEDKVAPVVKEEPAGGGQGGSLPELTEEEKNLKFFDFEKTKEFVGSFTGPGQIYTFNGGQILTWSFKDINGLPWLTPQWIALDTPQGSFKGFSNENPEDKFIYKLIYENSNDGKHNFRIFRKRTT